MWRRDDDGDEEGQASPQGAANRSGSGETAARPPADRQAVIGGSIEIEGEVTGDEDLTIQGHVDGSVTLEEHAVTVGPDGRVDADIVARVITVEGRVDGDLDAEEQVVLRGTARVEGDITAPRVVLEDGSYFRGAVDMDESTGSGGRRAGSTRAGSAAGPAGGRSGREETADEDEEEADAAGVSQ